MPDVHHGVPEELLQHLRDAGRGARRPPGRDRRAPGQRRDRRRAVSEGALVRRARVLARPAAAPAAPPRRRRVRADLLGRRARRRSPAGSRRCDADPGPRSVLYYCGQRHQGADELAWRRAFWRLYGGCTTTYGDLCWPAGLEATRLTLGDNRHSAPPDIANARLIVLWGKNPAETNIHQMAFVEQALDARRAADRRRPAAHASRPSRAELLVQTTPGTDGALALGGRARARAARAGGRGVRRRATSTASTPFRAACSPSTRRRGSPRSPACGGR